MATPWTGLSRINGDVSRFFTGDYGACSCDPVIGTVYFKHSPNGSDWTASEVIVGTITSDPFAVNIEQQNARNSADITVTNGKQIWQSTDYGSTWSET